MVMDNKRRRSFSPATTTDHDEPQSSSEGGPDSPLWGDDSRDTVSAPSHLSVKKRRSIKKRVVSVKIGEVEGLRSKGEAYPPSDSWAWRKYGQKPIKGSPYPRGYYRCSSSKGCPARKQVERNRVDPTTLMITYAYEHNHPLPTSKHHHLNRPRATDTRTRSTTDVTSPTTPSATTATTSDDEDSTPASPVIQTKNPFGDPPQLEFVGDSLVLENLGVEYNWPVYDVLSFRTPFIVGPSWDDVGEVVSGMFSMREEDESLFGDLGELPECSLASFS